MSSDFEYVKYIGHLDSREHVRLRPGMYVGGTDKRAMHNMISVLLDHVIEQAYLGQCNHVWIELRDRNTILLRDNSPGLPSTSDGDGNQTQLEALMQFRMLRRDLVPRGHWMNVTAHEVSFAVVNALSESFEVENCYDGVMWRQKYKYGLPITQLVGIRDAKSENSSGTQFVFRPDFTIFDDTNFDISIVARYGQEIAMLFPGMIVEVRDSRTAPVYETTFQYPEGLKTYIEQINRGNEVFHEIIHIRQQAMLPPREYPYWERIIEIEIAFQFSDGVDCRLQGLANGWNTIGIHLAALKSALLSCINEYMNAHEVYSRYPDFTWDEISAGVAAIVSVYYFDLRLFQQDNTYSVVNPEIFGPIAGSVFEAFFHEQHWRNSETLERIISYHLSRR